MDKMIIPFIKGEIQSTLLKKFKSSSLENAYQLTTDMEYLG